MHIGGPLISWHCPIVHVSLNFECDRELHPEPALFNFCFAWLDLVALSCVVPYIFTCEIRWKYRNFSQAFQPFCVQLQHNFSSSVRKTLWYLCSLGFSLWDANKKVKFEWKQMFFFLLILQASSCNENRCFLIKMECRRKAKQLCSWSLQGMEFTKLLIKCQKTLGLQLMWDKGSCG